MAGCPAQEFPVTKAKFQELAARAASEGFSLTGQNGTFSYQGIEAVWSYDEAREVLRVECTTVPFFLPCSVVNGQIRRFLTA